MKQLLARTVILSALWLPAPLASAAEETYSFDPMHSNVTWWANHFGFSNPSGKFTGVQGELKLDEAKPENSKVSVTIAMASLVTGLDKFDAHLKSPDFFDVQKFPSATFTSDRVEVTGDHKAKIFGTLTLHGVAKPVTLQATLNKLGENPISKKMTAGFSAATVIRRSDFGITYALPDVADEVKIAIESEANRQ